MTRLLAIVSALVLAAFAASAEPAVFTSEAFAHAQEQGKPILVHVTAPWCPTCAAQKPILSELEAQPQFRDLQVFNVDFDSAKDVLKRFKVSQQSTLIVFHGKTEAGRSVGETRKAAIESLLKKSAG